jgi:hypothetical protein
MTHEVKLRKFTSSTVAVALLFISGQGWAAAPQVYIQNTSGFIAWARVQCLDVNLSGPDPWMYTGIMDSQGISIAYDSPQAQAAGLDNPQCKKVQVEIARVDGKYAPASGSCASLSFQGGQTYNIEFAPGVCGSSPGIPF